MKNLLVVQLSALLLIGFVFGAMILQTEVYDEVKSRIVEVLCLSCIKLEPKTVRLFTFETVDNVSHPDFILENLTKGPVFLHYSEDVCAGCEIMFPIVKHLFVVEFEKQDMFWRTVPFERMNVTYVYVNLDHTNAMLEDSFPIYDREDVGGLPMFTIITLGYDHGTVRPIYTTLYGTLGVNSDSERFSLLAELVHESIEMYDQNAHGYHLH